MNESESPVTLDPVAVESSTPAAPPESSPDSSQTAAPLANAVRGAGPLAARGPLASRGPLAAKGLGVAKPASPEATIATASTEGGSSSGETQKRPAGGKPKQGNPQKKNQSQRPRLAGETEEQVTATAKAEMQGRATKVQIPNIRQQLSDDLMAELERELSGANVEAFLEGGAGMADRKQPLEDGERVSGVVLKIHDDNVFLALGGPDEGVVPFANFTKEEPKPGDTVDVIVRGINRADGLYILTLPGEAVDATEWEDIEPGTIVEATITGANTGGLECKVGNIRGFIPISQISEHRVEDTSEFVNQKFNCVVTESNERRGNLVLSRRAVMERERQEKKKEQLESIQPGDLLEGVVRSIKDFGAFVDLGALEGLIHISKLSWDRIKHPGEVLEVGQKIKVKIDSVDKETGKLSLSYRDLLENPWVAFANSTATGEILKGVITRIANFGAFVRLAAGVEGLVHISEIAKHRVSNVSSFLSEGQEVDVKLLSIDRDAQKIALSIKQAMAPGPEDTQTEAQEVEADEPVREPAVKASHSGPLRGGNDRPSGGERFGLRW